MSVEGQNPDAEITWKRVERVIEISGEELGIRLKPEDAQKIVKHVQEQTEELCRTVSILAFLDGFNWDEAEYLGRILLSDGCFPVQVRQCLRDYKAVKSVLPEASQVCTSRK